MNKDITFTKITPSTVVASYKDYFELNAGAIILDTYIIVIDTLLYPSQAREFRHYLEQTYNLPIKYLFHTHFHGDHVLGMGEFKNEEIEVFGAEQIVNNIKMRLHGNWSKESIQKWKEEEPENSEDFDKIDVFLPHWSFHKSHVLKEEKHQVEFYHSGGHCSCSSWVYFPEDKVIFTGDELASYNWPFISEQSGNPDTWIEAFEQMISLDVNTIIPGHGKIVDKNHLKEHLDYLKALRSIVKKAIDTKMNPKDINVPDFYEPAEEWQILKALEHLTNFYSSKYS